MSLKRASMPESSASGSSVAVCICTFRRASLIETLRSLAEQNDVALPLQVIVADNDAEPSARALVKSFDDDERLNILYVHAPSQNISLARNACLDYANTEFIAFIDDDEIASPSWLTTLLAPLRHDEGDVVLGHVRAIYPTGGAPWLKAADLHSIQPTILADGRIVTGYTCNCAFRRGKVGTERFDLALGRSGGEDTEFFARLSLRGLIINAAPDAWVSERVRTERASLRWLVIRSFRAGQTHARLLVSSGGGRLKAAAPAAAKLLFCILLALLKAGSSAGWRKSAVRGALHAGVIAKLCGLDDLQLY